MYLKPKKTGRIIDLAFLMTLVLAPWVDGCGTSPSPNKDGVSQQDKKSQNSPNVAPNSQRQGNSPSSSAFLGNQAPTSPPPSLQSTALPTNTSQRPTVAPVANPEPAVGYGSNIQALLAQRCTACHSTTSPIGGIALDSYGQAVRFYQASLRAIQNGTMPRGNPLTASQKQVFQAWGQAKFPK
jgi:mono/diheme cytochrome c family protein